MQTSIFYSHNKKHITLFGQPSSSPLPENKQTRLSKQSFGFYSLFSNVLHPFQFSRNSASQTFCQSNSKQLCTYSLNFSIYIKKQKSCNSKFVMIFYPSGELLRQRFSFHHNNRTFCDEAIEYTDHLLISCLYSNTFWNDVHDWLESPFPVLLYKE